MDLSICILTRNQEALLRRCVACCLREIEKAGVSAEIIIIDNASTDGSAQRVAELFPQVRVLRNEENLGFSAANNRAIRASQGRFVLILNDDAFLQEGSLRLLLEEIESSPKIGVVGPKLLNLDGSLQRSFTNRRFPRFHSLVFGFLGLNEFLERNRFTRAWFTHGQDPEQSGETDHIAGACLLARREALVAVGLFDERFHRWFEDTDLCYCIKEVGWKVLYVAEARVLHQGSATLQRLDWFERRLLFTGSLLYFFKKHSSSSKYFLVRLAVIAALLLQVPVALLLSLNARSSAAQEHSSLRASLRGLRSLLADEP